MISPIFKETEEPSFRTVVLNPINPVTTPIGSVGGLLRLYVYSAVLIIFTPILTLSSGTEDFPPPLPPHPKQTNK